MTYLDWKLEEDGGIESDTPLGNIMLVGDIGCIEDNNVMLDTFLEALIVGFSEIRHKDEINVDTIDEPIELVLCRTSRGVEVSYGDQMALIQDEELIHRDLVETVNAILRVLDEAAKKQQREPTRYSNLRYFINHGIPKSISLVHCPV